jgi:CheY-like chemotaxis protein
MADPKKTVLVVEDDRDCRDLIVEMLEADGYAVRQANNGRDALSQLSTMTVEPALVLLDMMMPEMDGAEFLRMLGARRLTSLPVVVLSAHAPGARALGARLVLRKPVELDALLDLVRDFCDDHP